MVVTGSHKKIKGSKEPLISETQKPATKSASEKHSDEKSLTEAAADLKVSRETAKRARRVRNFGDASVAAAVESNKIPVTLAADPVDAVQDYDQQSSNAALSKELVSCQRRARRTIRTNWA